MGGYTVNGLLIELERGDLRPIRISKTYPLQTEEDIVVSLLSRNLETFYYSGIANKRSLGTSPISPTTSLSFERLNATIQSATRWNISYSQVKWFQRASALLNMSQILM